MAKSRNAAYAGMADMPNGKRVSVFYLDAAGLRAALPRLPPGHPERKTIGWYWREPPSETCAGPFTSSRKAMQDAVAKNGGDHGGV